MLCLLSCGNSDSTPMKHMRSALCLRSTCCCHRLLYLLQCAAQVAKELESLHAAAAEQLEGLYEARLALEGERLAQLAAAKDDLELSLKVCAI